MDGNIYTVYMHRNLQNNKCYIGVTRSNAERRWGNGTHYKGTIFGKAIQKYGWDSFEHIILFRNLSADDAEAKEVELIAEHKSQQREFGYNQSPGGLKNKIVSEATRKRQSESAKRAMTPERIEYMRSLFVGKKLSDEHKRKISEAHKASGLKPITTPESILKMRMSKMKYVAQIDMCGSIIAEYPSLDEAMKATGVCTSGISKCCKNKRKTAGGYKWEYV